MYLVEVNVPLLALELRLGDGVVAEDGSFNSDEESCSVGNCSTDDGDGDVVSVDVSIDGDELDCSISTGG